MHLVILAGCYVVTNNPDWLAEAMVRSLEIEYAKNVDFGVGTVASREVPSDEEWDKLFRDCLKH